MPPAGSSSAARESENAAPHPLGAAFSWTDALDELDIGLALHDREDRLVFANRQFQSLYEPWAGQLGVGLRFEDLLRAAVGRGMIAEARGDEEAWMVQRLRARASRAGSRLCQLADGRWRRIVEVRLPDGSMLTTDHDASQMVGQAERVDRALGAARLATERLEDAIEALPAGFELWDAQDCLVTCNAELRRMYPRVAHLLVAGASFESLVRANQAVGGLAVSKADLESYMARRREARRIGNVETEHATGDGRWIRVVERPTRDGGLAGIRVDITELRAQRAAAEAAELRLREAIEALPDGFALYDAADRLVVCNTRYRQLYAESAPAMKLGARFEDILRHGLARGQYPQAGDDPEAWLVRRLAQHRDPGAALTQQLPGNRWLRIDERPTRDGGIAGVRADVTELVRREQQLVELNAELDRARAELERLSDTDALTGIANRRRFDRRLAEEWERVRREGASLTLLLVDVDHFKRYNDAHGHQAGDACLRRVAAVLADCLRRSTDLLARYGGEEFAILLPFTTVTGAQVLARRCIEMLDAAAMAHGDSPVAPHVTISLGGAIVAAAPSDEGPARLVHAADRALYRAKSDGRRRAVFDAQN